MNCARISRAELLQRAQWLFIFSPFQSQNSLGLCRLQAPGVAVAQLTVLTEAPGPKAAIRLQRSDVSGADLNLGPVVVCADAERVRSLQYLTVKGSG